MIKRVLDMLAWMNRFFFKNTCSLLKRCCFLFVLGSLSSYAFAPYFQVYLLFVGLAFLMHGLIKASSRKEMLWMAFSFGAGLGVFSLKWICNALLVDGSSFYIFIPIALFGFAIFQGVFYLLPAFGTSFFKTPVSKWLSFCAFFVFFEWVRSWIFTGFPWNLLGNIWTFFPSVLQLAGLCGVYGLSLITVLFFTSVALWPIKKRYFISLSFVFMLIILMGGLHLYQAPKEMVWGVKLRLVQPDIKQSFKWDPLKAEENYNKLLLLSKTNNDDITHVIWPETALPFYHETDEVSKMRLMSALRQGATLLTGGLRIVSLEKRQLANSLFIFDHLTNMQGYYDKSHLVPFGEYVPFRDVLKIDKIVPLPSDFVAGSGPKTMYVPKAPLMAPLVCYEVVFPHKIVNEKRRPEWILNITNDAWYGISAGPYQHLSIAQMRAVEEGLPLVRATNNGVSAVINPYGEIIASLDLGKEGVLDSHLPRSADQTIYARFGNMIPLLFILFVFILAIFKNKEQKIIEN